MKLQSIILRAFGLTSLSQATKIYVSSYSGNITTVSLVPKADGNLTLTAIALNTGCFPSPSWLELDKKTSTLYCADEGLPDPSKASFSSFQTSSDGTLSLLDKVVTPNGGVYTTIYGNDSVLAIAHYGGSAISIVNITTPSSLSFRGEIFFSFTNPGLNLTTPLRPYIHQTLLDPTRSFLLAPDLSADAIHVFSVTSNYLLQKLSTQPDITVPTGYGPRHGVFYQPGNGSNATYLYVVMETTSMVHAYSVSYKSDKTLNFTMIQDFHLPVPQDAAAAEIKLTPCNRYLIVSSRNDKNLTIPNLDPTNSTQMVSDTLFTFTISPSNGTISILQKFPAGGISPRAFSINGNGTKVAVALNTSNRLVVIARDVVSGLMTGILGYLNLDIGGQAGLVTSAVWDEDGDSRVSGGANVTLSVIGTLLTSASAAASATSGIPSPAAPTLSSSSGYSSSGVLPLPTSGGTSPPPSAAVATPTPFQAGMVGDCTKFYLVASGDTCSSIVTAAGISLSDFYTWNPAVGNTCATLFLNNNVCIGVGS